MVCRDYLVKRHSGFYFRIKIPSDLVEHCGRRVTRHGYSSDLRLFEFLQSKAHSPSLFCDAGHVYTTFLFLTDHGCTKNIYMRE